MNNIKTIEDYDSWKTTDPREYDESELTEHDEYFRCPDCDTLTKWDDIEFTDETEELVLCPGCGESFYW